MSMERKAFLAIFTLGVVLRALLIANAPLWYDESFTLVLARLPFDRMFLTMAGDVHPPLHYLITWSLFRIPNLAPWFIRLPSLLASILSLIVFWKITDALRVSLPVRVTAFTLMAILPTQIAYAQEGRMYALFELVVLTAFWASITSRWGWFWLSGTAMLYTQNYGMYYAAAIFLAALLHNPRAWKKLIVTSFLIGLAWAPWMIVTTQQMQTINGRYWITDNSLNAVLTVFFRLFWLNMLPDQMTMAGLGVLFVLLIFGTWKMIQHRPNGWAAILTMSFLPILLAWVTSALWQPILLYRPLIASSPFIYLIVAWPAELLVHSDEWKQSQTRRVVLLYLACILLPLSASGAVIYYRFIPAMKNEAGITSYKQAVDYIEKNWRDGDIIYHTNAATLINVMAQSDQLTNHLMPECPSLQKDGGYLTSLSPQTLQGLNVKVDVLSAIPHKRAWVFVSRAGGDSACVREQVNELMRGKLIFVIDENEYYYRALWLMDK